MLGRKLVRREERKCKERGYKKETGKKGRYEI